VETARKLLPNLLRRRDLSLGTRLEGAFHLVNNLAYVVIFLVSLLALPVACLKTGDTTAWTRFFDAYLIGAGIVPVLLYFVLGQLRTGRGLLPTLLLMPFALALGIGISLNNTRAALQALFRRRSGFVRTPKYRIAEHGDSWIGKRYAARRTLWPCIELALAAACWLAVYFAIRNGNTSFGLLMVLFAAGYLYVGLTSLFPGLIERFRQRVASLRARNREPLIERVAASEFGLGQGAGVEP
jgi:hypothetical protein